MLDGVAKHGCSMAWVEIERLERVEELETLPSRSIRQSGVARRLMSAAGEDEIA